MSDPPQKLPVKPARPIMLDGPHQASSIVIIGLALIALGVLAVFTTEVEAGPVAILGIGFALFIIGVAGQLPTKLGAGGASFEFPPQVAEAISDLYSLVPAKDRDEASAAIASLAGVAPELAAPALSEAARRELVLQMLAESIAALNDLDGEEMALTPQVVIPPADGYGAPWRLDAVIYMPQGSIAVEIMHTSGTALQRRLRAWAQYTEMANSSGGKQYGTLLIGKVEPAMSNLGGTSGSTNGGFVMPLAISGPEDQERLTDELRVAVHLIKKHQYRG